MALYNDNSARFNNQNTNSVGSEYASLYGHDTTLLVVLGSSDVMTPPRAAKALVDACPQSQVVTLPHAGHSLMAENPDGVREAIARFAARVFAPAG